MSRILFLRLIVACLFISPFAAEENFLLINKQMSPCSTFKIPLSLMGYDAEVLKDRINPTWNFQEGYDDFLPSWIASQTPSSWMKYSCVWYSKVLSVKLGLEKIQNYLISMEYGNQDASHGLTESGLLNPFWINGSIEISLKEQVDFLKKMRRAELPISTKAIQMTREILFKEQLEEEWKLFGKTGWSGSDITKDGETLEHSWFVGWIEKDESFYPFAYLVRDNKINLDQRIPRVKELLIQSDVMK
ncbi:MAG: class D beta-lactamase [Chlamydiae bacterium]|nr:class D beta-lactamase [Chlamydiota bacterium]